MRLAGAVIVFLARIVFAQEIQTVQVASGLPVPTDIQSSDDGSGRLFIAQQNGIVRILRNGALLARPFLDIRSKTQAGGERGFLGIVFPPGFGAKQRFYVDYTDLNGDTVIALYRVSADPDVADAASETVLFHIPQPFANHNGGQLRFSPNGYLYIGMGDGGSGGDPLNNGQNLGTLLGKLLRVDVESDPGRVRIPPTNPFVNTPGARPEIWAYGFRNPWRFSFDRASGDLWIADVGQATYEEVDFQAASSNGGENYGWNRMEGTHCFLPGCSAAGLVQPIAEYTHAEGCSVTGGFVYRGKTSPGLRGAYLYGDYCTGRIWGVDRQGGQWVNRLVLSSGFSISTFGEDESGEIYVANAADGTIHHVVGSIAPRLTAAGVVNPASYAQGMVAGSFVALFAHGVMNNSGIVAAPQFPLPMSLNGVSVTTDGIAAPILAVANVSGVEQVNFQAPFEIAGRQAASVVVTRDAVASAPVTVAVLELQPAVYTYDGVRAIAVHEETFALVTADRPLVGGEVAAVFATGLGQVTNPPATGAGAPIVPRATTLVSPQVSLGGMPCEVLLSGLVPGLAGVYQLSFRIPAGIPAGPQDLVVAAGATSAPVVTVPVR